MKHVAFALLLLSASCTPMPKPTPSYIPEIPAPPPVNRLESMRDELKLIPSSKPDDRLVRAEKLFNMVRLYRGSLNDEPPADLRALAPEIWSVWNGLASDKGTRLWLLRAAGFCRHAETTQSMMELADKETDIDTLCVLLDALGSTRDERVLPPLLRCASSENENVRKFAVFNAGSFKDDAVPVLLRTKLQDPSEEVRWYAAYGLACHHKDRTGFELLIRMLDRDYLVRFIDPKKAQAEVLTQRIILLAVSALRNLEDRRAIEPLRKIIRTDPSSIIKDACRETLRLLEGAP